MNRFVCIHGHFYQPPRENAWLEEIELQDSALPYHDWNDRICAQCYEPNTATRILGTESKIINIVNNYQKISFNFGPTLLSWMERRRPNVYAKIINAAKESKKRYAGHLCAIAQCYNHIIMPLANYRDKKTQVLWGIKDYRYRYGHTPEGMWLPETAVDLESLKIMADNGIKFTILAPHQAKRVRKIGQAQWTEITDGRINILQPYLCRLRGGKQIAVFFYNGEISRKVAFEDLLLSGENFAKSMAGMFTDDPSAQIAHIATDGETFGHHQGFGDMGLTYCLYYIEKNNLAKITVYGEFLEKFPPQFEVQIRENTSWSCSHGIQRWKSDCGCSSGAHAGWNQKWREYLRESLDWLRDELGEIYWDKTAPFVYDPSKLRDSYIDIILDRSPENIDNFFSRHLRRKITAQQTVTLLKLLEMQRNAMLMYTSCGWFFDEISGIETTQILQYASRAIQLAKDITGESLEEAFIEMLSQAQSNIAELENGAKIYRMFIKPAQTDLKSVASHYAVSSVFEEFAENTDMFCYTIRKDKVDILNNEKNKLAVGKIKIRSKITLDEDTFSFAVYNPGYEEIAGGIHSCADNENFDKFAQTLKTRFEKHDFDGVVSLITSHFINSSCSLCSLFKDEQRTILSRISETAFREIEPVFRNINKKYSTLAEMIKRLNIPIPRYLSFVKELMLNTDIIRTIEPDKTDYEKLDELIIQSVEWNLELDKKNIAFIAKNKINLLMECFAKHPEKIEILDEIKSIISILKKQDITTDIWNAQNIYFEIGNSMYPAVLDKAGKGDEQSKTWVTKFLDLENYLNVRIQ